MATLDKEIKVIAVKGQKGDNGKSSYELAVEELHYSGTLEEWIETFATPENYVTRYEFQKVTQAEYDALAQAQELIPDCYYIITDDTSYDDLIDRIEAIESDVTNIQGDIDTIENNVSDLQTQDIALGNRITELEKYPINIEIDSTNPNMSQDLSGIVTNGAIISVGIRITIKSSGNYAYYSSIIHIDDLNHSITSLAKQGIPSDNTYISLGYNNNTKKIVCVVPSSTSSLYEDPQFTSIKILAKW